jgi:hypothetical protein
MRYTLLIYGEETGGDDASPDQLQEMMDEYRAYEAWLEERGVKLAGEALQDTSQATTVRVRDGGAMTTDGPFAETKEQLGGFYLLECDNLDDALEAARRCPGSTYGSIEVRPVFDFSQMEAPE